jgi:hypothetical protein
MRAANENEIKEAVRERDGFRCTQCGMSNGRHILETGKKLEVHRLSPGTPYTFSGCVTLCRGCHASKPKSAPGSLPWGDIQVDKEVISVAKAAAALSGQHIYDWLSDQLNVAASTVVGRPPIVRKNFMRKRTSRR